MLYAGPQATFPGVDQINLQLPQTVAGKGEVPLIVSVAGHNANAVALKIR